MKRFTLLWLVLLLSTLDVSAQRFVKTFNTIAELLASPKDVHTNATVLGRNGANDNGGGDFYYDRTSVASTNTGTIFKPNGYDGRWHRVWDYSEAKPEWFGAKIDDGVDDQPAIQAALNAMWSIKTGIVKLSAGKYHIATPIRIPYRGVLKGIPSITYAEGSFDVFTNSFWMAGGSSHIRLMNGANCKMVILAAEDDPNAYVRQANETLEDGSIGNALFQWSLIEDIVFEGNPANQTEYNCHSIYAERKFSVTIRNCSFAFQSGCPIYFRDVNTGLIENCYFQGSGTAYAGRSCFIYSSADCKIRNVWGFGNSGPSVWLNGDSSFVNTCSDFMIGNSLITNTVWAASSVSGSGTWTFPSAIPLSTGDHVELRTTGTLPSPFNDTTLYFVYKVAPGVYTLHTSMPSATNGVYLTPVGGSGVHSFTIGPASALYLSGGARHNDFTGVRCDQNGGPGITIRNAHYNTITGGILSQNYAAVNGESSALTESVGLRIEKDSIGNQVINVNARLQGYAYQLLDTCKSNLVLITSDPLTTTNAPLISSSERNNYLVMQNDLGNTVLGSEATQTALYLIGNASGQRVLKAYRHNVGYFGIGVHPQGLTFFNETNSVSIGQFYADTSQIGLNLGTSGAPGRLANINGEASTGTDAAGGNLKINSGLGTGNGIPSQIQFYTPNTNGISGSTAQVYGQQRFKIDAGGTTFTDRLNLYSVTSDPSDLVDGTAFYRSDTDKFRVRYNSTTANVATEDWVTANFTPGAGLADGDYGDITVSGTGTAINVDNSAITYAKMQNVSAVSKLLGRNSSTTGPPEEITLGSGLTMTGSTLSSSGGAGVSDGDKGDITISSSGTVYTIDNDVVSYAKIQNVSAASKLIGRGDSGSGDAQEITLGSGLTMTGTTLSSSGGGVSISGTPVSGQAAEWVSSSAIKGVAVTGTDLYVKSTGATIDSAFIDNSSFFNPKTTDLDFEGSTSGFVTLTVPAVAGTHTVLLPTTTGSANQLLKTDGSGQWGWVSPYNIGVAETTVASATTTDLGAVASDKVSITGTTTITGFGTVAAGVKREGRFTGALTLTHNATSLIVPGGASLTTAAGDRFQAYSLGSGNWVVSSYTKADGTAVVGGGSIADDSVTNAKMANMAASTIKARVTGSTGDPEDATGAQVTALLSNMVGDSGSGGTKGLAPAPSSGDAAAGKFLKASGTYELPAFDMANIPFGVKKIRWTEATGGGLINSGITLNESGPANVNASTTESAYRSFTTAATTDTNAGATGNSAANDTVATGSNFDFRTRAKITATASVRVYIGMSGNGLSSTMDSDTVENNSAVFRFSTSASDTNWQFITKNTGTQQVNDTGVAIGTTIKQFRVVEDVSGATVKAYINGVLVATNTTLPTSSTALYPLCGVRTLENVAKTVSISSISVLSDF